MMTHQCVCRLQEEFEQLLADCSQVTPGKPMSDVRIFFLGKDCFESLADSDAQEIYDRYQRHLVKRARQDFVELLLEHVNLFVQRIVFRARRQTPVVNNRPALPGLSEVDMNEIRDILQEDIRYRQLNRLFEARDNMICQYASFVSYPLIQHCPAGNRCIDSLVDQILASHAHRAHIFDSGSETSSPPAFDKVQLNLVILGGFGLPDQLIREIRHCLPDDVYQGERGGPLRLCYRVVEGDVRAPTNRLTPGDALAVVFSSRRSLDVARDALTHSLLFGATASTTDEQSSLRDLLPPAVVILACDPNHLDDLPFLQQQ
uniref:PG1 pseudoGTPase domain-containing protein n=2 Tax=Plectus sambesii TaxID=2011161 RepID=A0A914UUR9_9BILA